MSQPAMTPEPEPARSLWPLALCLGVELAAVLAFQAPNERFTRFAYCDSGADLTTQALLARGLRPTLDFGYIYGLLPLALNRAWYGLFGATPAAFRGLSAVCLLGLVVGLARFATALRVGLAGAALIALALPDMAQVASIVLVHALEPALLVNALAYQARGRRDLALALTTACLFVKPSMAFAYGLALLLAIALDRPSRWWPALRPALVTGLALSACLALAFGPRPLANTLIPGAGLEVYRANGYGFFRGAGRAFWLLPGAGLRDYFRYEVGAWLLGTLTLLAAGGLAAARLWRGNPRADRTDELIVTCAILHAAFVTCFFGNRVSWVYYYPVLILGLAAFGKRGHGPALAVVTLAALVLIGSKAKTETTARLWKSDAPSASTFGLWASPVEHAEWEQVRALCRGHKPAVLLANVEGATLLDPETFEPSEGTYFVPGHPVPAELRRKAEQISRAQTVVRVRPGSDPTRGGYERWPEIAEALQGFRPVWEGAFFAVEQRERPVPR